MLLSLFLALGLALWISVIGYLLSLRLVARRRRVRTGPPVLLPAVVVVLPVRNEEGLIAAKLADLEETRYPRDLLSIVVVDGGSTDRTVEIVREAIAHGSPVGLLECPDTLGKTDQIRLALEGRTEPIAVVTDVDAALEASCVRELVTLLLTDPKTALVGAVVEPATPLPEERLYWRFLSHLWWLEGEALGATIVSGVAYAFRREMIASVAADAWTDDVHLAMLAASSGRRVRLWPPARAIELRVPTSRREFLTFRRRRGKSYRQELRRVLPEDRFRSRFGRWLRVWQLWAAPWLSVALVLIGFALLATPDWGWSVGLFALFAGTALLAVGGLDRPRWITVAWVIALVWFSLLTLPRDSAGSATREVS